MKRVWNSFLTAFAMFSKIPVPRADWEKENMKYMICFFPGVGAVIGLLAFGWGNLCREAGFGPLFRAAVFTLIPAAVSGGIHLDGFLDTVDALSSCQPREQKLTILKDSHAGAFAIIVCCAYFVLSLGVWSEINEKALPVVCLSWTVSRSLSGLALATFPCANKKGSLSMFADAAQKRVLFAVLTLWILLSAGLAFWLDGRLAALMGVSAALVYVYYYRTAMKQFGGTTGDVAGFFVQAAELAMASAVMLGGKLV